MDWILGITLLLIVLALVYAALACEIVNTSLLIWPHKHDNLLWPDYVLMALRGKL